MLILHFCPPKKVDRKLFDEVLDRLTVPGDTSRIEEREQALLALLEAGGLKQFDVNRLLSLAERAGFFAVMEVIFEAQGRFAEIVPCYIRDKARGTMVFQYIHRTLQRLQRSNPQECQRIKSITIDSIGALVQISPRDLARLMLVDFADVLSSVVTTLRSDENKVYAFLDALVAVLVRAGVGGLFFPHFLFPLPLPPPHRTRRKTASIFR